MWPPQTAQTWQQTPTERQWWRCTMDFTMLTHYTTQDDTHELVDETGEYIVYYDEDSAAMFLEPSHMAELDLGETLPEVTAVEVSGPDDDATWTATAEGTMRSEIVVMSGPFDVDGLGRYPAAVSR